MKAFLLFCALTVTASGAWAQSQVTTGGKKYTLMEEATGTWCQWCPDGAQVIQADILPYGTGDTTFTRAIVASFHNGNSDSMLIRTPFSDPFSDGTPYITGFPMGTVDRAAYGGNVGISRGSWDNAVAVRDVMAPKFDVSMVCLYDSTTRVLTMRVKAKALVAGTGPYRINAYIVEDSISSAPVGYRQILASQLISGASPSASAAAPTSWYLGQSNPLQSPTIYAHMDAVRRILATTATGGIWGDTVAKFNGAFAVGDSAEKVYYDTIPTTYRGRTCYKSMTKVIGLVQKYGSATTDREIDNCIEAKVRYMWKTLPSTGVATMAPVRDLEIFPNPAQNVLIVRGMLENPSTVDIRITNSLGQSVLTTSYPKGGSMLGENIHIESLSNGIYFMTVTTDGGTVSKQFTVSK